MAQYWQPTGSEKAKLRNGMKLAFDHPSITLLISDYFAPESFGNISPPGFQKTFEYQLHELIEYARMNDWLVDLLAAAHERRPNNPDLAVLAENLGLTTMGRLDNPTGKPFQEIVQQNAKLINLNGFIQKLPLLANQVCWVDVPGGGGTGFLVGPDLVLTNYHVIERVINGKAQWQDVRCRFDYKQAIDGSVLSLKKLPEAALSSSGWLVDKLPTSQFDWNPDLGDAGTEELDYALLRLADRIGDMPVGGDTLDPIASGQPRGWIDTSIAPAPLSAGNQIFLLQHPWLQLQSQPPRPEPLTLSIGSVLQFNHSGTRLRYDANTKEGSSGCPCFNADLQLVALHHAHDLSKPPKWNQAVPFTAIQNAWQKKGIAVG